MYFANPLGLLGLPVILAIHLFRQRFPPLVVAGAHLWGAETRITTAGRKLDRLPVTATLILELLAALLLSLGLSQPKIGMSADVSHLIVALDDSASMQAGPAGQETVRDRAIAEVERRMRDLGSSAVVTLIRSGPQPALLGQRGMNWSEARGVLDGWQPLAPEHDFRPVWDEAAQVAGEDGRFLFLTDRLPEEDADLPRNMELLALGRPLENVALSAAGWDYDSPTAQGELFFRVANYGSQARTVSITGVSKGATLFERSAEVPPEGETPFHFEVPGGLGTIQIAISGGSDGLDLDNRVTLIEPKVRIVHVAIDLPADADADPVRRVLEVLPDLEDSGSRTDLLIGSGERPPVSDADQWWFGIGPLAAGGDGETESVTVTGPFILNKQHPLLEGITMNGVIWGGVRQTDQDMTPLISCDRRPLLGQLSTPGTAFLMNIDLSQSNLSRTLDWPVLLSNLVEMRRDALPGLRRWNYRVDETVSLRIPPSEPADADELVLVAPDGSKRNLVRDRNDLVEIMRLRTAGIYRIEDQGEPRGEFAVNFFDPRESSLSGIVAGERKPEPAARPTTLRIDDPYTWLIMLAVLLVLAALLIDWYILSPAAARPSTIATSRPPSPAR
jgi:hypothetical protein